MAPSTPSRPQLRADAEPDNLDPNLDDLDEPDSRDDEDLDAIVEDLAAAAPIDRDAIIEVEAALSYVHDRLDGDGDALAVLGLALDRIAQRHAVVVRHVAKSIVSLQAERGHALLDDRPSGVTRALEAT